MCTMNERPAQPPEGKLIAAALKRSGMSARKAAKLVPISEGRWRQIVNGYQTVSAGVHIPVEGPPETVARMASVVRVTPEQLEQVGRADVAEELRALPPPREPDRPRTLEDVVAMTDGLAADNARLRAKMEALTESLRDVLGDDAVDRIIEQSSEKRRDAAS